MTDREVFNSLRIARVQLAKSIKALRVSKACADPVIMKSRARLSKNARLANLQFACMKGQSLYTVESPPYDALAKRDWAATIIKMIADVDFTTCENPDLARQWISEVREIRDQSTREIVNRKYNMVAA